MNMVCKWLFLVGKTGGFGCNFIEKWLVFYYFLIIKNQNLENQTNIKYVF